MGGDPTIKKFHGGIRLKRGIGLLSSGNGYGLRIPEMNHEKIAEVASAFEQHTDAGNKYQLAKQLTYFVHERFEYEDISADRKFVNLISAIDHGKGICKEKAALYQVLAQRLGIDSYYVRGRADGGRHAWCKVHV